MKKRLFFGFACFVGFTLLIAWQVAAAELADLQKERDSAIDKRNTEVVSSQLQSLFFV
ncbi:hypothetical protein ACXYMT_03605 [Salinimicrobium sp. CAU 1759]